MIYRLSRAPERRIFYIDVGNLPKIKAEQYLRDVMNRYRNKLVYDASTGEIKDDRKHMAMLEDFWLPRREGGRGTEITTLPGGQNLGELADIEYFQKKLYDSLGVPPTRLAAESGFNLGRSSEILRDELKFTRFVGRLRKRLGVVAAMDPYLGRYFSADYVRRTILGQTDSEIKEIDAQMKKEIKDGIIPDPAAMMNPMGAMGAMGAPQDQSQNQLGTMPQEPGLTDKQAGVELGSAGEL